MLPGPEPLCCEERLRELGLLGLEQGRLRGSSPMAVSTRREVRRGRSHFLFKWVPEDIFKICLDMNLVTPLWVALSEQGLNQTASRGPRQPQPVSDSAQLPARGCPSVHRWLCLCGLFLSTHLNCLLEQAPVFTARPQELHCFGPGHHGT